MLQTVQTYTSKTITELNKNISGIYKITHNSKPEVFYIGSAVSIRKRWQRHALDLFRQTHCTQYLQRTVVKYGVEGLCFEIIEIVKDKNLLAQIEQKWLDNSDPNYLYNSCLIVGTTLGLKFTKEQSKKMSILRLGYKHSEETKAKMSKSNTGVIRNVGKIHSEETKNKIKMSHYTNSLLNEIDIIFIKGFLSAGYSQKWIAKLYSISSSTVGNINTGKTWSHISLSCAACEGAE